MHSLADVNDVARRYFQLRKELKHKVALGEVKKEFNLPLHYIMGFDDLQVTYEEWKKAKRYTLLIDGEYGLTEKCLNEVAKYIALNPVKVLNENFNEIVGEAVKYTAQVKEGQIELKISLIDFFKFGKWELYLIYDPYEDFIEDGLCDEVGVIALEIKKVD